MDTAWLEKNADLIVEGSLEIKDGTAWIAPTKILKGDVPKRILVARPWIQDDKVTLGCGSASFSVPVDLPSRWYLNKFEAGYTVGSPQHVVLLEPTAKDPPRKKKG